MIKLTPYSSCAYYYDEFDDNGLESYFFEGKARRSMIFNQFSFLGIFPFLLITAQVSSQTQSHKNLAIERLNQPFEKCNLQLFESEKISAFLPTLRGRDNYPMIEGDAIENELNTSPLQDWVRAEFEALQDFIFQKQILVLKSCLDCQMQTDSNRKVIYVNPDFVAQLFLDHVIDYPREFIRFALAHEIAHYVYELGVIQSPRRMSLFGNRSLFRGSQLMTLDANYQTNVIEPKWLEMACGHAEVDFYAATILFELGYRNFLSDTIRFFERLVSKAKLEKDQVSIQHFQLRLDALDYFIKN